MRLGTRNAEGFAKPLRTHVDTLYIHTPKASAPRRRPHVRRLPRAARNGVQMPKSPLLKICARRFANRSGSFQT